jgi:hypothetical protein
MASWTLSSLNSTTVKPAYGPSGSGPLKSANESGVSGTQADGGSDGEDCSGTGAGFGAGDAGIGVGGAHWILNSLFRKKTPRLL